MGCGDLRRWGRAIACRQSLGLRRVLGVPHIEMLIRPPGRTASQRRRCVDRSAAWRRGRCRGSRGDFLPSVPYCGANRYGFPLLATAAPAVGFDIETLRGFRVCDGIPGGTLAGFGAGSLAEYATLAPMVRRFGR